MFCTSCGREFQNDMNFCPYCGAPALKNDQNPPGYNNGQNYYQQPYGNGQYYGGQSQHGYNESVPADVPSVGFNALAFLFPIVGLILYLVWKDSTPNRAKAIGKWALISVIAGVVVYVLWMVALFSMVSFSGIAMDSFII